MAEEPADRQDRDLAERIGRKEARKLRARRDRRKSPWFWAGMFGLVGWSVAIPAVAGAFVGAWADRRWGGEVSWTLTGVIVGMALGCVNAWYWVRRESQRED